MLEPITETRTDTQMNIHTLTDIDWQLGIFSSTDAHVFGLLEELKDPQKPKQTWGEHVHRNVSSQKIMIKMML